MINLPAITGENWFNSKPLIIHDLIGKVVLVDFWTYSCVNCQRTLPYLREWWKKYKDKGLVIIGVHSPEFEFEKKPENVKYSLKSLDITWPIVMDNDFKNWDRFANKYWPAKYLADKEGHIVYHHFGEGAYAETEAKIIELLEEDSTIINTIDHTHDTSCIRPTPETYLGYYRGKLANDEDFQDEKIHNYTLPENLPINNFALGGEFVAYDDYVESVNSDSILKLNFTAYEVNIVLHPVSDISKIEILFNDRPLQTELKGSEISKESILEVSEPRLYNLISSDKVLSGELTIRFIQNKTQAYAFTFSGCKPSSRTNKTR